MDPLDHIHHIRTVFVDDALAKDGIVGEDRVHVQTDKVFHCLFFVDCPDKDSLARVVKPLYIFISREGLLDADDICRFERFNTADSHRGSVGCQDSGIDLAYIFESAVIL